MKLKPIETDHDHEEYFSHRYRCPKCRTFLATYSYGRAWTGNGLRQEYRTDCKNCGQEIDWSDVPFPKGGESDA